MRAAQPEDHGTLNAYTNLKCRCADCRKTWREYCAALKGRREAAGTPERIHGTVSGRRNYGCKCKACVAAEVRNQRIRRNSVTPVDAPIRAYAPRSEFDPSSPDDPKHGTITGYVYKCRCDRCRSASAEYSRERRLRKRLNWEDGPPPAQP